MIWGDVVGGVLCLSGARLLVFDRSFLARFTLPNPNPRDKHWGKVPLGSYPDGTVKSSPQ